MMRIRRSNDRGHANHGWLDTRYTFSFADYYDPEHMGFRSLRVMNEDFVAPGKGFPTHGHRDMEIVTLVLEGALEHKDSLGTGSVLRPGEMQRITAGTGILHSEFNPSKAEPVHLYQIWLLPEKKGLTPSYEQRAVDWESARGRWQKVASRSGGDASLTIHQDAGIHLARLTGGQHLSHAITPGRHAWLQVLRGTARVDGQTLAAGDGVAVSEQPTLAVEAIESAEILLFDLA